MALLFMDSFDDVTSGTNLDLKWGEGDGANGRAGTTSAGRTGRGGTITTGYTVLGYLRRSVANVSTVIVGVAVKPGNLTHSIEIITGFDGSTLQWRLKQNTDGTLSFTNGDGTVLATTSNGNELSTSLFSYLEVKVTTHNSTGAFRVLKDGAVILSGTGVDTSNSGNAYVTKVGIGRGSGGSTNGALFVADDFYLCDDSGSAPWNTFLSGEDPNNLPHIGFKAINGAGTTTQWTPDSGSNYARVNESDPDGNTSYVSSANPGDIDTYAMASSGLTTNTILGVQHTMWAKLDSTGSRTVAHEYRSGGANHDGASHVVTDTASYAPLIEVFVNDPDTGSQITRAALDALEAGRKLVS